MKPTRGVDGGEKFLVELVRANQPEVGFDDGDGDGDGDGDDDDDGNVGDDDDGDGYGDGCNQST